MLKNKLDQERWRTLRPIVLFLISYLVLFDLVEKLHPVKLHVIDCSLDHYIPFIEIFVVPYLAWFFFIGLTGLVLYLKDFDVFVRFAYATMFGMALFIVISFVYPNGLELRPDYFERDNIFVTLTKMVYKMDTSTNVLPSIHVYNTVCAMFAIWESEYFRDRKTIRSGSLILSILICLSTMFLKQHSIVDVLLGLVLSLVASDLAFYGLPENMSQKLSGSRVRWRKELANLKRFRI